MGFYVDCKSHFFAIRKWVELLTPRQRQALVRIASRPSQKGKAPMEEDNESRGPGVSGSVQGESTLPQSRAAVWALAMSSVRSSGDLEGVECDAPELDDVDMDGAAFLDEDTVPPPVLLSDEEW
ncbi:hypothetical protein AMTR_s00055p00086220 [Amborella trichopoda]|uniref:Uncharacterized protein n=1 Tax=Amborella trichopoda TaxID=13333 RepID=U5D9Y9_AMBTC|nr:hypothetical protein AMTR_s00055p00086220 [Amborella trichopoda]